MSMSQEEIEALKAAQVDSPVIKFVPDPENVDRREELRKTIS